MNHAAICENGQPQGNPVLLLPNTSLVRTIQFTPKRGMTQHQKHPLLDSHLRSFRATNTNHLSVVLASAAILHCDDGRELLVLR